MVSWAPPATSQTRDRPVAPDGDQARAVRAERQGPDIARVAREIRPLAPEDPALERPEGPEDHAAVAAAGGQELAVGAEGQALDGVHVAGGLGVVGRRRQAGGGSPRR